jgi:hypothetical protein
MNRLFPKLAFGLVNSKKNSKQLLPSNFNR